MHTRATVVALLVSGPIATAYAAGRRAIWTQPGADPAEFLVSTRRRIPRRLLLAAGWSPTAIVGMAGPTAWRALPTEPVGSRAPAVARCYNRGVMRAPLSSDTSPDVELRQIDAWRRMSASEKAAVVTGLTRAAFAMTAAGVRHRHPNASPREHFLRMAVIVLGPELARRAYPDAAAVIAP